MASLDYASIAFTFLFILPPFKFCCMPSLFAKSEASAIKVLYECKIASLPKLLKKTYILSHQITKKKVKNAEKIRKTLSHMYRHSHIDTLVYNFFQLHFCNYNTVLETRKYSCKTDIKTFIF